MFFFVFEEANLHVHVEEANVKGMVPWWWMHVELDRHTLLMYHYQEILVGGSLLFGDLENSAYGLIIISKLLF